MARLQALLRLAVRPVCPRQHFVARRAASSSPEYMTVLGIETSADDTCIALLRLKTDDQKGGDVGYIGRIGKVTYDNKKHGGIHPVEAVQSHTQNLARMLDAEFSLRKCRPALVCVTRGPGMGGCLSVGVSTAKALSVAWSVPVVGVHHMQAHALTVAMENALDPEQNGQEFAYPFLTLLVSGKHTMLVHTKSPINHRILAQSENIALGDILDKMARELVPSAVIESQPDDLPICYPILLEQMTSELFASYVAPKSRKEEIKSYRSDFGWVLQPPLQGTREMKYEFNGLGSQTRSALRANPEMAETERQVLGLQFMRLAFEHLMSRVFLALETDEELLRDPPKNLILSGGVASNMLLRTVIQETLEARGFGSIKLHVPRREYCTDNAAMIAYAGWKMYTLGWRTDLGFCPVVKWSMEEILSGVDCWKRRDGFPDIAHEDAHRGLSGQSLVTEDSLTTAQEPSSSITEHEDNFPGESLFFPNDSVEAREEGSGNVDIPLNHSKDTANGQTAEEQPEQSELPSKPQEENNSNDLAELSGKEPKEAEIYPNNPKDVAPNKQSDAPKEEVKTAQSSSKPSIHAAHVKSSNPPGNQLDEVNLKLELLMEQADSLLGNFNSDSSSGNKSAAEKSQAAASKTKNTRTPAAQITTSTKQNATSASGRGKRTIHASVAPPNQSAGGMVEAEHSNSNHGAKKRQQDHQQQQQQQQQQQLTALNTGAKKSTTDPVSSKTTSLDDCDESSFSVWRKAPPRIAYRPKEWSSMPALSQRGDLKVRHLGFAKEPSPPASKSALAFIGRIGSMFGLGRK